MYGNHDDRKFNVTMRIRSPCSEGQLTMFLFIQFSHSSPAIFSTNDLISAPLHHILSTVLSYTATNNPNISSSVPQFTPSSFHHSLAPALLCWQ